MNIATERTETSAPERRRGPAIYEPRGVARDLGYVLPGFFISLFAFVLLVTLTSLAIGTLVIWIGAVLLPLSLYIATGFAEFSRARLRAWGIPIATPRYLESGPGAMGRLRWVRDPRRWLDLLFETCVAFPLRTFTFCVAITWIASALGGLSWPLWGYVIPDGDSRFPGATIDALSEGTIPASISHSFLLEALCYVLIGLIMLATLPPVMRGLAWMDAATTRAGLGSNLTTSFPASDRDPQDPTTIAPTGARPQHALPTAEGWAWIAVGFVGIAGIAAGWPILAAHHAVPVVFAMLIVVTQVAGLLLAVRRPEIGIALAAPAAAAAALLSSGSPWPWPVTMLIVQAVLALIVALRRGWRWVLAAWLLPQLAVIAVLTIESASNVPSAGFTPGSITNLVISSSITVGMALLGIVVRAFVEDRGALRNERRVNAELDTKQQELAERNRVAQELHDVVAHSMSVVSVQANTAKYRLPGLDERTEAEFASIAESSRQALGEMRGLLATLRQGDASAPLAPQPSIGDIPGLIESTRQSGTRIDYRPEMLDTGDTAVPASTGLTAYRIVQETLSNAVRHAPGAEIMVTLRMSEQDLEITVHNGPAHPASPVAPAPGSGLGLAGLHERVSALGGTVTAGPTDAGGFAVHAALPR
ncbi:MAG: sensor domain-containing protein [Actinobacteria bacterium]|nr:sensor domain-containing protein [Actinomycetota bacterium]